jgi:membrane protease YdiL (CAAX protease family)
MRRFRPSKYVLNHTYRLKNGPAEWAMLFCFGLACAAALYYSRSLWPAVGLHWGWNFAGKLGDSVAGVDLVQPMLGPALSALAHLALLGIVVLVARAELKSNELKSNSGAGSRNRTGTPRGGRF